MGDLIKEMVQTKERAAAWVFRILITLVGTSTMAVLWLAWYSLQDVKSKSETGIQLEWLQIGKINDAQQEASRALGILTQQLSDHLKVEANIDDQLKEIAKDHEQRLRGLERPHS